MSSSHNGLERGDSLSGEKDELVNTGLEVGDGNLIIRPKNCCVRQWESFTRTPRWIRCLLLVIIIITYYLLSFNYTIHAYDNTNSTNEQLTARIIRHSISRKTCDDTDYGCCKIYYNCRIVNSINPHIDFKSNNIDLYRVTAHDTLKSNCPSLRYMINKYNQKYGSDDCGNFGCCDDFNTINCDDTLHNILKYGNGPELIDHFKNNTSTISINVPKIDEFGSNCWNHDGFLSGINHFIDKYEHYYPDPEDSCDGWCILFRIVIIGFVVGCMIPHR